ncbi:MAG: hypothetical protein GY868_15710, partial [Deltaproteobacteria bacterium]|nr:hypothetical protein [Deltaproteobacteria bacterium]
MLNKKIQIFFGIVFIVLGLVCISCEDPENGNADPGTADAGCPTEPLDTNVTIDTAVYNAEALCNNDTVCDDGETVMSCPGDCWDITRTTTC